MSKKQKNVVAAWVVVIIAFLGGLALANVQNKVPPVMIDIMGYFQIGETDAGWLMSIFAVMGMITAIPAAFLLKKFGAKVIGCVALGCAALGSLIGVFSTSLVVMMASRVIEGIGVGMIAVVGPALIAMWFPPQKRGLPMGLWGSWMMASQTILFLLAAGITTSWGWQGVWWFTLIFCVIVLVLYMWKVEEPPEGMPNYSEDDSEEKFSFKDGFKSPSTWLLTLVGCIFTFCCFGFATYIAMYWGDTFFGGGQEGMDISNLWVAAMYAIEIPIVILIGWLLNHIKVKNRKFVGAIGFALYAVILFICFRMQQPGLLLPFILIYPFLEGSIPTVYWTNCPSTCKNPAHAGIALGIMNVGLNIGTLLGPPVTGFFIENYGWQTATIPLTIAAVVGAILFLFVKTYDHEPKKEEATAA